MDTENVNIKHNFTDAERLSLGEQQSELLIKQDELEARLKSAKTQMQSDIDANTAQIRAISSKLQSRYEFRNIECIVMDHRGANGDRHIVRLDTGHVVKHRKLRPDETQIKLTGDQPKEFVALAYLPVDDRALDADFVELRVFEDEFEALRSCPDVKMRDIPKMVGDGKADKKKK